MIFEHEKKNLNIEKVSWDPRQFLRKNFTFSVWDQLFNHWAQLRPVRHQKSSLLQEGHLGPPWDIKNQNFFMVASFGLVIPRLFIILRIGWSCYIAFIRRACALRALGLLLYSRIPHWEGGRLFDGSTKFFYGSSCNSRTESRKIVPKVGN